MKEIWKIQDAKSNFSDVIAHALTKGPQLITKNGEKTAIVLSYVEYKRLCKSQRKLSEFFKASPLADIDLTRDKNLVRKSHQI